ncbi:hypothetical protein NL676_035501 [Syzygium grande]|nr:hypothetical protein NL676_035501 [Syzygium grande]
MRTRRSRDGMISKRKEEETTHAMLKTPSPKNHLRRPRSKNPFAPPSLSPVSRVARATLTPFRRKTHPTQNSRSFTAASLPLSRSSSPRSSSLVPSSRGRVKKETNQCWVLLSFQANLTGASNGNKGLDMVWFVGFYGP